MHYDEAMYKRLAGDPKKHEQKNGGNFYAGSGSKTKSSTPTEKHKVSTVGKHK